MCLAIIILTNNVIRWETGPYFCTQEADLVEGLTNFHSATC